MCLFCFRTRIIYNLIYSGREANYKRFILKANCVSAYRRYGFGFKHYTNQDHNNDYSYILTMLEIPTSVLKAFAEKLNWFRINIQKENVKNILELTEVSEQLFEQTRKKYEKYLMKSRENLNSRFSDLFSFEVQPWMMDSFGCDIESVHENMQE